MADLQDLKMDGLESIDKISAWLQPTDYLAESSEYCRHLATQAPGTGLWLRQTDEYRRWRDSEDCGSMWVKGVPGAGKSVVAASMVHLFRCPQQFPVLFFFFRQIVAANHTPRSLIKDWLDQLLPHSFAVQRSLNLLLKEDVVENCSDDQLWHILQDGLSSVPMVYCVADALDEMNSSSEVFLSRLNNLAAFRPQSVKLLLTSRPKQYLQSALRNAHIVHVSLEKDLVQRDIAAFVWHRLNEPSGKGLSENEKHALKATICAKSQGLFLYAKLIIDQVLGDLSRSQTINTEALTNTLPVGLAEMYNDILYKQRSLMNIEVSIQTFLLQCVTHSARPLRLNELASALKSCFYENTLRSDCKALARTSCGPLLQILEDETVQVIHHSFTEFLCDDGRPTLGSTNQFPVIGDNGEHKSLFLLCLSYLRFAFAEQLSRANEPEENQSHGNNDNENEEEKVDEADKSSPKVPIFSFDYQRACLYYPLLEYAVSNWIYHVNRHNVKDQELFDVLNDFLNPDHRDFQIWLWLQWGAWRGENPGRNRAQALHVAAFGGLTEFAEHLFTTGVDVNQCDTDGKTALHWASREGHYNMTVALLRHGANANPEDRHGLTPFHEAAKKNRSSLVRLFLNEGIGMRTPKTRENHAGRLLSGELSTKGETPLEYACQDGNTESVCEMLEYMNQADLDEALCLAIRNDRVETVQAIFEKANPSPNATLDGSTALYLASAKLQESTVCGLLARGADVSLLSGDGPYRKVFNMQPKRKQTPQRTPIHGLLGYRWHIFSNSQRFDQFRRTLRLLVDAGVDIEAKDLEGDTALLISVTLAGRLVENIDLVQILLDCGASALAVDRNGDGVLKRALAGRVSLRVLQMLLDHGPKPGDLSSGGSILGIAVSANRYFYNSAEEKEEFRRCIELLIHYGAECDFDVLRSAFRNRYCNMDILRLLLASSHTNAHDKGLLLHDIRRGDQDPRALIELLIEQGADIETRNSLGQAPFLSQIGDWPITTALLEHGARWDVVDTLGRNALWTCPRTFSSHGSGGHWERLLEIGLDPLQARNDGCNLLHEAARSFHGSDMDIADFKRLMDLGLDINHQNLYGSPPLHIRQETGVGIGSPFSPSLLSVLRGGKQTLRVDAQDSNGFSALHLAAKHFDIEVARLLDAGADACLLTNDKENALHIACKEGQSSTVDLLIQHSKGLIASGNIRGETPLHLACLSGRPESIYYLLKADGYVRAKDAQGNTPLHSCARFSGKVVWEGLDQDNVEAEQTFREIVKPPHLSPSVEETWYHPLAIRRRLDTARVTGIVKMLLAHGADPSEENKDNHTPLDLAILWGNLDMAELLLVTRPVKELALGASAKLARLRRMSQDLKHPILDLLAKDIDNNDLFSEPFKYSKVLTVTDLRLMVKRWQKEPEIEKGPYSLVVHLASFGLTEFMEVVGSACKLYDDADWIRRHRDKKRFYSEKFQPPLQAACSFSYSMPMIELLVDQCGVDVNAHHLVYPASWPGPETPLESGNTALHCLAIGRHYGQIGVIRWLVERGANVNARNEKGETPLHIASYGERTVPGNLTILEGFWSYKCLKVLLDLGADPNATDNQGLTCLNKATRDPGIILELLRRGASMDFGTPCALFSAINIGTVEVAAILLDHGAQINRASATGTTVVHHRVKDQLRTPLFCAAMHVNSSSNDRVQMTTLLLRRGADWKAPLNDRETLVHYVFENAKYEVIREFLASPNIDYNFQDQIGRTVLHAACSWRECLPGYGHQSFEQKAILPAVAMLDLGADIERLDEDGRSALHCLLDNENLASDVVLSFLKRPECFRLIATRDKQGYTPLQVALRHLHVQACNFLLSRGADFLDSDGRGWTALHYLFNGLAYDRVADPLANTLRESSGRKGTEDAFDFPGDILELWEHYLCLGGDINAKDKEGDTPLFKFLASSMKYRVCEPMNPSCHIDTFPVLFSDADVAARNNNGETALHVVAKRKPVTVYKPNLEVEEMHDAKLFKFLMTKGLDPLAEDDKGRSALDVAAVCGKGRILEIFRHGRR